jgi:hypothetical protein
MKPNFILVKSPDPLNILAETFPELRNLLEDAEYGTYYVYEPLCEDVSLRQKLKQSVGPAALKLLRKMGQV